MTIIGATYEDRTSHEGLSRRRCEEKLRWVVEASLVFAACASVACPPTPPLTNTPTSTIAYGSETAAAYSRSTSAHPGTLIVAFNDANGALAWAYSVDGKNWNQCSPADANCWTAPGGKIPTASGLLGRYDFYSWGSDPGVAASVDGQTVVFSDMGNSTLRPKGAADSILVSSSIDGGRHLVHSEFANAMNCVGASEDQPSIAADPANANRYWVGWRHQGTEIGYYGACIAGFDVDPTTGAFSPVLSARPIDTQHELSASPGGLIVQALGNIVMAMYSNTAKPIDVGCGGSIGIVWLSDTSTDGGKTWSREARIDVSNQQKVCLPVEGTGVILTGMRNFALAIDPLRKTMWAAVPADDNLGFKILTSSDRGLTWNPRLKIGMRAYAFFPTLAMDDVGRLGMSFQMLGTTPTNTLSVATWFAVRANSSALGTPFLGAVPISRSYPASGNGGSRSLGDYAAVTSISSGNLSSGVSGTFLPTWTEVSSDGRSIIAASLVRASP